MTSNKSQSRNKLIVSISVIILCFLILEGAARWLLGETNHVRPGYVEISEEFVQLDGLISDIKTIAVHPPRYYDEFLYGPAPISLVHVTITDYYSARLTPDSAPLSQADNIVWMFGGSTMKNLETTDDLTIANILAKVFNQNLGPTHVKNFGAGSFTSSFELIKFMKLLREVPANELPTLVVFYDGYNDANHTYRYGAGRMQRNLSLKLKALVEHEYFTLSIYSFSQMVSRFSTFWQRTGARLTEFMLFPPEAPKNDDENLDAGVRVYAGTVKMINAICESLEIKCFFLLQPMIVTKTPLEQQEQDILDSLKIGSEGIRFVRTFYESVRTEMSGNSTFIDTSHILNGRTQTDFYDLGHTSAATSPVIGETIARMILSRVETEGQ